MAVTVSLELLAVTYLFEYENKTVAFYSVANEKTRLMYFDLKRFVSGGIE